MELRCDCYCSPPPGDGDGEALAPPSPLSVELFLLELFLLELFFDDVPFPEELDLVVSAELALVVPELLDALLLVQEAKSAAVARQTIEVRMVFFIGVG